MLLHDKTMFTNIARFITTFIIWHENFCIPFIVNKCRTWNSFLIITCSRTIFGGLQSILWNIEFFFTNNALKNRPLSYSFFKFKRNISTFIRTILCNIQFVWLNIKLLTANKTFNYKTTSLAWYRSPIHTFHTFWHKILQEKKPISVRLEATVKLPTRTLGFDSGNKKLLLLSDSIITNSIFTST